MGDPCGRPPWHLTIKIEALESGERASRSKRNDSQRGLNDNVITIDICISVNYVNNI